MLSHLILFSLQAKFCFSFISVVQLCLFKQAVSCLAYCKFYICFVCFFFFQAVTEQPQGSEHELQNTADEMTISDDCGLQDGQRDGSSNVMHSTEMDSEEVNVKEEQDVSHSMLSGHSYEMGHDMSRGSCEVGRVQEIAVPECKYESDMRDQGSEHELQNTAVPADESTVDCRMIREMVHQM